MGIIQQLRDFYNGKLLWRFICSKTDGEYRLFYGGDVLGVSTKAGLKDLPDGLTCQLITKDGTEKGSIISLKKGQYTELRCGKFKTVPKYLPNTKVLALKPTESNQFEKVFSFAKIVSGPKSVNREITIGAPSSRKLQRNTYELKFAGEKTTRTVFEEFIVPVEKYWGKEQEEYKPDEDDSSSSSESDSSSSESETSSSSESESSSSSERKIRKHKSSRKHKKDRKHSKKHRKHNHTIIIPIFIPYPMYSNYYGY